MVRGDHSPLLHPEKGHRHPQRLPPDSRFDRGPPVPKQVVVLVPKEQTEVVVLEHVENALERVRHAELCVRGHRVEETPAKQANEVSGVRVRKRETVGEAGRKTEHRSFRSQYFPFVYASTTSSPTKTSNSTNVWNTWFLVTVWDRSFILHVRYYRARVGVPM